MKKLAKTFLTIGKVLGILGVIGFAIAFVITLIVAIVGVIAITADGGDEEAIAAAAVGIAGSFTFLLLSVLCIVSLIFTGVASKGLRNATTKGQMVKPAVFAIIAGALITTFPIVAGIMMLAMPESQISGNAENTPENAPEADQ